MPLVILLKVSYGYLLTPLSNISVGIVTFHFVIILIQLARDEYFTIFRL